MAKPKVPGYVLCEKLGSGTFADVYKGQKIQASSASKEVVAIKCIIKGKLSTSVVNSIVTEIKLLKTLKHPHIVQMKDFLWDDTHIYIVMEYCGGGDLSTFIRTRQRLKESVCRLFLQQLASALQYLRQHNVAHMDLKPQNLLLTSKSNPTLKLTDFGLAQSMTNHERETSLRGSPLYMAPEILLQKSYDASVDLWSVGVILFECLFGRAPYSSKNLAELVDKIKNAAPIAIPPNSGLSAECTHLLTGLLQRKPEQRMSFEQFFSHPFLKVAAETGPLHKGDEERAERLIQRARDCEGRERVDEAFRLYCEALNHLLPVLQHETDSGKRQKLQEKVNDYVDRAEELKKLLSLTCRSRSGSTSSSEQQPCVSSSQVGATPFEELRNLVSTTPSLKAALQIGIEGVQYDAEGQYATAFERYETALQQILQLLNQEPKGRRRTLLHQQATLWMDRAEKLKQHLSKSQLPSSTEPDLADDLRQCRLQ